MMRPLPRDLRDFARENGYVAQPCSACTGAACDVPAPRCANCGGSGRIWHSPRGSLSDDGLQRLRELQSRGDPAFGS
jgi:hypothetical protein